MEEQSPKKRKRLILLSAGLVDSLLGGVVLLIYFGILPLDISSFDIPHWVIGLLGGIWFFSGLGVLTYQLTKTQVPE